MKRAIIAAFAAFLFASPTTTLADPTIGVSFTIGSHARNDTARCTSGMRMGMLAAQAADALTAGAAYEHGGLSRTPFGASPVTTYIVEQAGLDLIVGALMRRASCGARNLIDGFVGASAIMNATQNRSDR